MRKKYRVQLTSQQRRELRGLIASGEASARKLAHARILLKADENGPGLIDRQVAEATETSVPTVQRVRERFSREGLSAALERKPPDRIYQRKIDGNVEARLIALACSEAPEGRGSWTLRLLADRAVELGYVESISHEAIRQTLKKTNSNRT